MTEQETLAVIAAASAVVGAIAGGGFGVWLGAQLGAQQSRKDRLRALYSDVMAAALRLTPKTLGFKMSDDSDIPLPAEVDGFIAKLMVENEKDDDPVRTAFVGVFNFSMLYGGEQGNPRTPSAELAKTGQHVKDYLAALQSAMREQLK